MGGQANGGGGRWLAGAGIRMRHYVDALRLTWWFYFSTYYVFFLLLIKIFRRGVAFGWVRLWEVDDSGSVVRRRGRGGY